MKHFISIIVSAPSQDFTVSFYLMYVKCSRALYLHNFRIEGSEAVPQYSEWTGNESQCFIEKVCVREK